MPLSVKWSGTKIPSPKVPSPKSPVARLQHRLNVSTPFVSNSMKEKLSEKQFLEAEANTSTPALSKPYVYIVSNDIPITSDEVITLTN
jgi:hypothetical protein